MNSFDYNPYNDLWKVFQSESSLNELSNLLTYLNHHKLMLNQQIKHDIDHFNQHQTELTDEDIIKLINTIKQTQEKSDSIQQSIASITTEISKLDNLKKNLTLSMNIFKRLQILNFSISELNQLLKTEYDYKDIYNHLNNIKDLLVFFKPYKSIDEINKLHLIMSKIETRLIDNIFIDFEEILVYNKPMKELSYSCLILELIDIKQKDKLLTWFYNLQLKEIKSIFNHHDEAGSLDNLNRRFIYFNNTLNTVKSKRYQNIFPANWNIDLELATLFCEITKEDILTKLSRTRISSEALLNCLNVTLDFENSLNTALNSTKFTKTILKVFEPYLNIWINEQDKFLNSKLVEFYAVSKIPQEFQAVDNYNDFLNVLKINSIPNISNSSIELFKSYQKILIQILKLSNGKILIDLANLFNKYLAEYHNRILLPILLADNDNSNEAGQIESIKYLTMVLNTGDYILNNLDDLYDKFVNIIDKRFENKNFSFDNLKDLYLGLINRAINKLVDIISRDLRFSWRQFENNNWNNMESTNTLSTYMIDFKSSLTKNCKIILPLIIRESYVRNFCNKLIELILKDFANHLKLIKPLSILNIEQILSDLSDLKKFLKILPLHANPNFNEKEFLKDDKDGQKTKEREGDVSLKYYDKFVDNQFSRLETLLKLLLTPILPVDNVIENYFQFIGDRSLKNFRKFLNLKNLTILEQRKYVDNFNLQLSLENNDLIEESPILSIIDDESNNISSAAGSGAGTGSGASGGTINTGASNNTFGSTFSSFNNYEPSHPLSASTSPPPVDDTKSPKLKINNLEKNLRELALNSENNITKFNENFKNFGKFFRKDNPNQSNHSD